MYTEANLVWVMSAAGDSASLLEPCKAISPCLSLSNTYVDDNKDSELFTFVVAPAHQT